MLNIDDFPDGLMPKNPGKPEVKKAQAFSIGGDPGADDDLDDEEQEEPVELGQPPQAQHQAPPDEEFEEGRGDEPPPAVQYTSLESRYGAVDRVDLMQALDTALEDPAVAALARLAGNRFASPIARNLEENARVTRGWLKALDQRSFFLAVGYPGHRLVQILEERYSLLQLRQWVDGLDTVPADVHHILMLENLLERRNHTVRAKMPTRLQIEQALASMPAVAPVSKVIGGFEACDRMPQQGYERGSQILTQAPAEVAELLKVVRPDQVSSGTASRPGANLPTSRRAKGQGRPMGVNLLKPDSYCYTLSKRSVDHTTGHPRITPQGFMAIMNKAAELERRWNVYYSIRRKDMAKPWSPDNVELLPTKQVQDSRSNRLVGFDE